MINLKNFINKLIISTIVSYLFFYFVDIDYKVYFLMVISLWLLMLLNFKLRKSLKFFDTIILVFLGTFVSFIFTANTIPKYFIMIYLIFFFIISISSYSIKTKETMHPDSHINKSLMVKRKKDLDELIYSISMFDIVGLNAPWGIGKSYLIEQMKPKIENEYEIIEIDILACNLNELPLTLVKSIEKVMYKNGIISEYSNSLKRFFSDDKLFYKLQGLLFGENQSYSETIKGMKSELIKADKKLMIIYEDIDRIEGINIVKNIFSISEKLSGGNVKILYQYNEDELFKKGLTPEYLEKYIPFKMNVTENDFFEILIFLLKENKYYGGFLDIKDFDFLRDYGQAYRYNVLQKEFSIKSEINIEIKYISMRKVENFLKELTATIIKEEYKGHKETVIGFLFIKHFINEAYKKINIEQRLLDTFKIKINSDEYTMPELISAHKQGIINQEQIEEASKDYDNKMSYAILKLFDYENIELVDDNVDYKKRINSILEEPVDVLKKRVSNDKKDRLIWNMLARGKSYYTNYEFVGRKFIDEVLEKSKEQWADEYNIFYNRVFQHDSLAYDNDTIFKFGIPPYIEMFKCFNILNITGEQHLHLVDFYIHMKDMKEFNVELVQALNYCIIKTKKEYIGILSLLNELEVTGNMNSQKCFRSFIIKYIGALSKLFYIDVRLKDLEFLVEKLDENKEFLLEELLKLEANIGKLRDKLYGYLRLEELKEELTIIVDFIKKIIEIINCKNEILPKKYGNMTTNLTSRMINQEEYDRLKDLSVEDDVLKDAINDSYKKGNITVHEVEKLIDELSKSR